MGRVRVLPWVTVENAAERSVCERYANRIRAYALRHLRDSSAAQDLVQHVLLAVLSALREGRIEDPARLDAYVFGTCRNAVMDMRRGEARQRRIAESVALELPLRLEPAWVGPDRVRLENCLRELEARDRAVVLETFVEDRNAEEIGRALKLTSGNVRVIRHRALLRLQGCMDGGPG